ncbi:hypothetical protein P7I89_05340 [Pseudomonas aeruginosa]|nr:hypothetical protein P7I89_05340 [Pseudomonas aeruginosa]
MKNLKKLFVRGGSAVAVGAALVRLAIRLGRWLGLQRSDLRYRFLDHRDRRAGRRCAAGRCTGIKGARVVLGFLRS